MSASLPAALAVRAPRGRSCLRPAALAAVLLLGTAAAAAAEVDLAKLVGAAGRGDPLAQLDLARRHDAGDGVPRNRTVAALLFQAAAEQGEPEAAEALGRYRLAGLGGPADRREAAFWLGRAAAAGRSAGQVRLAELLLADEAADAEAIWRGYDWLGRALAAGTPEAAALAERLAQDAPPERRCLLAEARQDWQAARSLCPEPGVLGDNAAAYAMGRMAERGLGGRAVPEEAMSWYRLAAERGFARAANALGRLALAEAGRGRDGPGAADWVRQAAEQGFPPACFNLAYLYERGLGVPRDDVAGANWLRRAAAAGHTRAQFNLAVRHAEGRGVRRDPERAAVWFQLAATPQGIDDGESAELHAKARAALAELAEKLGPAGLAAARREAAAFRPRPLP